MGPSQSRRSFQRSNPLINGRDFHLTDGHCRSEENAIRHRSLKEKSQNENEIRQILETKLKIHLPRDLNEALNDGVVLCHFINQLHPHSIASIHVPSPSVVRFSFSTMTKSLIFQFVFVCFFPLAKTFFSKISTKLGKFSFGESSIRRCRSKTTCRLI